MLAGRFLFSALWVIPLLYSVALWFNAQQSIFYFGSRNKNICYVLTLYLVLLLIIFDRPSIEKSFEEPTVVQRTCLGTLVFELCRLAEKLLYDSVCDCPSLAED